MKLSPVLVARRARHLRNVDAAIEASKRGALINLSALMIGAEQTGAEAFGGDATVDNDSPLASDHFLVSLPEESRP